MLIKNEDNVKSSINLSRNNILNFSKSFIKKFKYKKLLYFGLLSLPLTLGTIDLTRKIIPKLPDALETNLNILSSSISFNEIASRKSLISIPRWPINYLKGLITPIEVINLNVNQTNLNRLGLSAKEAIKKTNLDRENNPFVGGYIVNNNQKLDVRLRLKGDNLDHLYSNSPSFRVHVKGNKTLKGMKKFSLQSPKVREYASELIFHLLLKESGLPYLRYEFVRLSLNGENMGIYALEEHFDKITIGNNELREGIIIALEEDNWWEASRRKYQDKTLNLDGYEIKRNVKLFESKKILNNPKLKKQYEYASELLKGFIYGQYKVSEVFEIDKLGKFLAISDLLGGHHALHWNNLRFAYNPLSKKLIPVGFDSGSGQKLSWLGGLSLQTGTFYEALKNPDLAKEYLSFLKIISEREFLDQFFSRNDKYLSDAISKIHRTYPWSDNVKDYKKNLIYNQGYIQQKFNPIEPLTIFIDSFENRFLNLSFKNNSYFPLLIEKLTLNEEDIFKPKKPILLSTRNISSSSSINLNLELDPRLDFIKNKSDLYKVHYKILGTNKVFVSNINKFSQTSSIKVKSNIISKKENVKDFIFLEKNELEKTITIRKGKWTIDKPLIIPEDYLLKAYSGVNLELIDNGIIFAKGGISLLANENAPINISSKDKGMGIIVHKSKRKSYLKNVVFRNLSVPKDETFGITGALSFYESPVEIESCIFDGNNSEDSINIINSKFAIKNSKFIDTRSDAIDIDFGEGIVKNINFKNIGNDAIDVSGTRIKAENILINGAGDKGISVGERSEFNGNNIIIENSLVGIASKDSSEVTADEVFIKSTKIGFAIYGKKEEFGPAYMNINSNKGSSSFDVSTLYLLESPSTFVINKYRLPINSEGVFKIIYNE